MKKAFCSLVIGHCTAWEIKFWCWSDSVHCAHHRRFGSCVEQVLQTTVLKATRLYTPAVRTTSRTRNLSLPACNMQPSPMRWLSFWALVLASYNFRIGCADDPIFAPALDPIEFIASAPDFREVSVYCLYVEYYAAGLALLLTVANGPRICRLQKLPQLQI